MMKCLITGANGFLGSHLAEFLSAKGMDVYAAGRRAAKADKQELPGIKRLKLDITNRRQVFSVIQKIKPQIIFHLAAQSLVLPSWKDPEPTFKINVMGTMNLFDAVVSAKIAPKILVACSSAEYGTKKTPIRETDELLPSSPYAVSKLAQNFLSILYGKRYGLWIVRMRPFLVVGPRKKQDVCAHFAKGIAAIEKGKEKTLRVGNLKAVRDFVDFRDAVNAMWLMISRGKQGQVYNLCSGRGTAISEILKRMIRLSHKKITVTSNPKLLRPLDEPVKIGDNHKLRALGWKPKYPLEQTLAEILHYWRNFPA